MDTVGELTVVTLADASLRDVGEVLECEFECAYGLDENRVKITCAPEDAPPAFGYFYVDGTPYGGCVDEVRSETSGGRSVVTCSGRSWQGMLAARVLVPDEGSDHLTASGPTGEVLRCLIARMGLGDVFEARDEDCAGRVERYEFERFCDGYSGIRAMLRASGLALTVRKSQGGCALGAVSADGGGAWLDSDRLDLSVTRSLRRVNHLVCAGTGEMAERNVLHLYADGDGNVSRAQTLFGADEVASLYDYSGADTATLEEEGRRQLEEMQGEGSAEARAADDVAADVGSVLRGRDNATGVEVTAEVSKVVAKLSNGRLSVSREVGEASVSTARAVLLKGGGGLT